MLLIKKAKTNLPGESETLCCAPLAGLMLVLMFIAGGCPVTQSQDTPVSHITRREPVTGCKYYLYVPSTYSKDKSYPLVITLHGTNPWDTAWMQIREWKALAERRGFIVAAPLLKHYSTQGIVPVKMSLRKSALAEDNRKILAVLEEICTDYNVSCGKVLLTGFSAGGYPMYYTGLRHPEKFNMLIARACNCDMWIFEDLDMPASYKRVPIGMFWGKDDLGKIHDESWAAFRWLRRHGWNKRNCIRDMVRGGHLRRPETSYDIWKPFLGQ